jgi:hypothetical protein
MLRDHSKIRMFLGKLIVLLGVSVVLTGMILYYIEMGRYNFKLLFAPFNLFFASLIIAGIGLIYSKVWAIWLCSIQMVIFILFGALSLSMYIGYMRMYLNEVLAILFINFIMPIVVLFYCATPKSKIQ